MKVFLSLCFFCLLLASCQAKDNKETVPSVKDLVNKAVSALPEQQQNGKRASAWAELKVYTNTNCLDSGNERDVESILITTDRRLTMQCGGSCIPTNGNTMKITCSDSQPSFPPKSKFFGGSDYSDSSCKNLQNAIFYNKKLFPDYKGCSLETSFELTCFSTIGLTMLTACSGCGDNADQCVVAGYFDECSEKVDQDGNTVYESVYGFECSSAFFTVVLCIFILILVAGAAFGAYIFFLRPGAPCRKQDVDAPVRFNDEDIDTEIGFDAAEKHFDDEGETGFGDDTGFDETNLPVEKELNDFAS